MCVQCVQTQRRHLLPAHYSTGALDPKIRRSMSALNGERASLYTASSGVNTEPTVAVRSS